MTRPLDLPDVTPEARQQRRIRQLEERLNRVQTGVQSGTGPGGSPGADGATWYSGSGAPAGGLGSDGDHYFRTDTDQVYKKIAGSWGSPIADLTGAAGATGAAGSNGTNGTNGANGRDSGINYKFATGGGNPGSGNIKFDNATFGSITLAHVPYVDDDGATMTNFIQTWDDSTSAINGHLIVRKVGTPATFMLFTVTGSATDTGVYFQVGVTPIVNNGTFSAADETMVEFIRAGDKGDTGAAGSGGGGAGSLAEISVLGF